MNHLTALLLAVGLVTIAGAPIASAGPLDDEVPDAQETIDHLTNYDLVGELKEFLAGGCMDPTTPDGQRLC